MDTTINLGTVMQAHNAIKDARTVKRHAWEAEDAELEADQNKLKALLLDHLNKTGSKSIATDFGTAYRTEKIKPSAADWAEIQRWIVENDAFDLLEKRLKSTFIKDFMDANEGRIPPGVNVHREFEVSVRRANTVSSTGETK